MTEDVSDPKWIDFKEKKPDESMVAYVTNKRGGGSCFIGYYIKHHDIWRWYNPDNNHHICIDVTHYYPLPLHFRLINNE